MTNFDLLFSFLEIMLWLHIVLGVTISRDSLLQKAYCTPSDKLINYLVSTLCTCTTQLWVLQRQVLFSIELSATFWVVPSSDITTLILYTLPDVVIWQSDVSSPHCSFNPPYFSLLICFKCSVLHLQHQSQWVLSCTCLWMAFGQ